MFNEYRVLNYESFENIVAIHCKNLVYQDSTYINEITGKEERVYSLVPISQYYLDLEILLQSGLNEDETNKLIYRVDSNKKNPLSESFLSKCRTSKKPIPRSIQLAYLKENVIDLVQSSFETDLISQIYGDDRLYVIHELMNVIDRDLTIPRVYRSIFKKYAGRETLSAFLAEIFVFVMTKDISSRIIELEEEEMRHPLINHLVQRVVDEVAQFGRSSYFVPVLNLLDTYIEELYKGRENSDFSDIDVTYFVEGTKDYCDDLLSSEEEKHIYEKLISHSMARNLRKLTKEYIEGEKELIARLSAKHHMLCDIDIHKDGGLYIVGPKSQIKE